MEDEIIDQTSEGETTDASSGKESEAVDETTEEQTTDEVTTETALPSYRQTAPTADDKKAASKEMVPLAKYMDLKRELKEAQQSSSKADVNSFNSEDLDALASEYEVDPGFVKKLAATIEKSAEAKAKATIEPVLAKEKAAENTRNFNLDFDKSILAKYGPEAEALREDFKRFAFSPDFLHLKSLEEIRAKYYPSLTPAQVATKVKEEVLESGSKPGVKGSETIDFAKMDDETHTKVLADPKLRAKYYDWQETQ